MYIRIRVEFIVTQRLFCCLLYLYSDNVEYKSIIGIVLIDATIQSPITPQRRAADNIATMSNGYYIVTCYIHTT